MERALKTVRTRVPAAVPNLNAARDALITKFRDEVITNITDFRKLSKIATSVGNLGVQQAKARAAISDILNVRNKVSIQEVYAEQFEMRYDERKVTLSIDSLLEFLKVSVESGGEIVGEDLKARLVELKRLIDQVLQA
jgi:uncharacterized protein YicC (UPF0701 family)